MDILKEIEDFELKDEEFDFSDETESPEEEVSDIEDLGEEPEGKEKSEIAEKYEDAQYELGIEDAVVYVKKIKETEDKEEESKEEEEEPKEKEEKLKESYRIHVFRLLREFEKDDEDEVESEEEQDEEDIKPSDEEKSLDEEDVIGKFENEDDFVEFFDGLDTDHIFIGEMENNEYIVFENDEVFTFLELAPDDKVRLWVEDEEEFEESLKKFLEEKEARKEKEEAEKVEKGSEEVPETLPIPRRGRKPSMPNTPSLGGTETPSTPEEEAPEETAKESIDFERFFRVLREGRALKYMIVNFEVRDGKLFQEATLSADIDKPPSTLGQDNPDFAKDFIDKYALAPQFRYTYVLVGDNDIGKNEMMKLVNKFTHQGYDVIETNLKIGESKMLILYPREHFQTRFIDEQDFNPKVVSKIVRVYTREGDAVSWKDYLKKVLGK